MGQRLIWLLLVGLMLVACAPATSSQVAPPAPSAATTAPSKSPTVSETATGSAAPTEAPAAAPTKKPIKTELEATDPTTVKLAAGRPQLVEFFAFW